MRLAIHGWIDRAINSQLARMVWTGPDRPSSTPIAAGQRRAAGSALVARKPVENHPPLRPDEARRRGESVAVVVCVDRVFGNHDGETSKHDKSLDRKRTGFRNVASVQDEFELGSVHSRGVWKSQVM